MEQIAWMIGHTCIYWSAVVRTLAVAAAVFAFLALYVTDGRHLVTGAVCVPMAMALSLLLARIACWYFHPDSYESLEAAVNFLKPGGAVLMGAFAGCFLTAVLLRLLRIARDLPELLDCMALAGCLGISLGRLTSFFNSTDRGMLLVGDWGLPWADTVVSSISGGEECRLATFLLQSAAAGLIFLALVAVYLWGKWKKNGRNGDVFFLFFLLYGSSQVVLDSTRYDALYLRSNGFVSVVQVLSALAVVLTAILYSARMVREKGWRKWYVLLWLCQAACLGLAGYMEYHVQRHGSQALFAYSIMSAALMGNLLLCLRARHLGIAGKTECKKGEKSNENHDGKPTGI